MICLRTLSDSRLPPDLNMAVDEILARSLETRPDDGFIRFYQWAPPSFSFGYFQKIEPLVDPEALAAAGFGVVRRQSGGRMVFHGNEWTFSVGAAISSIRARSPGSGTFLQYFQALLQPLVEALQAMNLPVRFADRQPRLPPERVHPGEPGDDLRAACYSSAAGHSLYLGEEKLIGAAGIEKKGILAIHGSIPIAPMPFPQKAFHRLIDYESLQIAWLRNWLSEEQIARIPEEVFRSYRQAFAPQHLETSLSAAESTAATQIAATKYSTLDWPQRLSQS